MFDFTDAFPTARANELRAWKSFDAIVQALLMSLRVVGKLWWEPGRDERLRGCHRASFVLTGEPKACDAFFNSPQGYRGQYARSVAEGKRANRRLLHALEPMLIQAVEEDEKATEEQVRASLRAEDAKVWIDESWFDDERSETTGAIEHLEWERNEPGGLGLQAPVGTVLQVKGGWLDAADNERRDPRKERRSFLIYSTGFSG